VSAIWLCLINCNHNDLFGTVVQTCSMHLMKDFSGVSIAVLVATHGFGIYDLVFVLERNWLISEFTE
jgi:hypothetical protein